jgi:hypothetical protein
MPRIAHALLIHIHQQDADTQDRILPLCSALHGFTVLTSDAFHHFESIVDNRCELAGTVTASLECELKNGCPQDGKYGTLKEVRQRC